MSTTIVVGAAVLNLAEAFGSVEKAAIRSGYAALEGLSSVEEDASSGLAELSQGLDLSMIAVIKAPADGPAPLAFGIQEELAAWELNEVEPKFFGFLKELSRSLSDHCSDFVVSFSGEWYEDDRVRLEEGPVEALVDHLRQPGNWCQRLYVPGTACWQDVDEVPLVFRVRV